MLALVLFTQNQTTRAANMSAPALSHCLTLPAHSFNTDVDPSLLQPARPSTTLNPHPHPHHCNVYTDQRGATAPPWTHCVKRADDSCTYDLLICLREVIISSLGKKIRWTCVYS